MQMDVGAVDLFKRSHTHPSTHKRRVGGTQLPVAGARACVVGRPFLHKISFTTLIQIQFVK